MRLREGLAALRTAKPAQAIPMLPEALTLSATVLASHCRGCFYIRLHGSIIQRTLAVCQDANVQKKAPGGLVVPQGPQGLFKQIGLGVLAGHGVWVDQELRLDQWSSFPHFFKVSH